MALNLGFHGISLDAADPALVGNFWSSVLGWPAQPGPDGAVSILSTEDPPYVIRIEPADTPKPGPNKIHFDLTSDSPEAMTASIERALAAGGQRIDIGQGEVKHEVLADPEGNELCIIAPGNQFLADTGAIGGINCDGSQALGYFWSEALGWPLVWDQDEETAIQSPNGGSKITWSGPPYLPRYDRDRLRLVVSVQDESKEAAIEWLLGLGGTQNDDGTWRDPDGNEFTLISGSDK
ncbi:VOC family protein [Branchiibius sp. NY16-3462-2]|uniref:VOC family protein n=1 Tax=Branchiibius sp. NY16-3462-2 TaxID=1807500 RepID=UPI00079C0C45|nr:VOC family protein [Branchiibius sp. NY16-3462-2]KYH43734.1 bleomycin resistance protein [Branchiibius sp. NY16-3462-2]